MYGKSYHFNGITSICGLLTAEKFTNKKCHTIINNTAGNCYFECRSKRKAEGGCETTSNIFFGGQESICLCLCDNTSIQHTSESKKCNIICKTSINNGRVKGFFSVYESKRGVLLDTHFGGSCLSWLSQNDFSKTLFNSIHCNKNAAGQCIESDVGSLSLPPIMSAFGSYWIYCRNNNQYIVGDTSQNFCQRDTRIWTGLQIYKIDNFNIDTDSCYIFEIQNGTVNYKRIVRNTIFFFVNRNSIRSTFQVQNMSKVQHTHPNRHLLVKHSIL